MLYMRISHVSGPPPLTGVNPLALYEWDGPPPHPCCSCSWYPSDAGAPASQGALWIWGVPRPWRSTWDSVVYVCDVVDPEGQLGRQLDSKLHPTGHLRDGEVFETIPMYRLRRDFAAPALKGCPYGATLTAS